MCCTAPTVTARLWCDMAQHGKASNAIGAGRARIAAGRFS